MPTSTARLFLIASLALTLSSGYAAEVTSVITRAKRAAQSKKNTAEQILQRIAPLVNKAFRDVKWATLEPDLKAAGLEPTAERLPYITSEHCLVLRETYAASDEVKLDLHLTFDVSEGRSQPSYTVPPDHTIANVGVSLKGNVRLPLEQVRKEHLLGKDSILDEALAGWPVDGVLKDYPVLQSVALEFTRGGKGEPHQYRVQLDLVKGKEEGAARRRLECVATLPRGRRAVRGPLEEWSSRDFATPGTAASLVTDLTALLKEKEPSYQLFLRKATKLVHKAMLGRDWPDVAKELEGQELKSPDERSWQYGMIRTWLVNKDALLTPGGQRMDLELFIMTARQASPTEPTREVIMEAYALLKAQVEMPYSEALSKELFGKDSAVHQALLHENAAEAAKECPFLESVEVYYDIMAFHRQHWHAFGFSIHPEFRPAKDDKSWHNRPSFLVVSGLDPLSDGSAVLLDKDFISKDTLGEPYYNGGNAGGSKRPGDPDKEESGSFWLVKKGESRWRKSAAETVHPVMAYGLGDLKTLPAGTAAIRLESREIYDEHLALLARFADLKVLDLGPCVGITDAGLKHLAGLAKLESLTLAGEVLSGEGLEHLPGLKQLKIYDAGRINDRGTAAIAKIKSLTHLSLHYMKSINDDQLGQLAALKDLRELHLWGGGNFTDAGMREIAKLKNLQGLTISRAKEVTTEGISQLEKLASLVDLTLSSMPVGDDALASLSRMGSLEYVTIRGAEITGEGLQALAKLPRLKSLSIDSCKQIRAQDAQALLKRLQGEFVLK